MPHSTSFRAFALCAAAFAASAINAQQPQPSPSPSKTQPKKAAPTKSTPAAVEVDPMVEVRRTTAISLITTLADDARTFRDPTLRARVQARAADALWETEKERARTLFRRAWDEAETADAENDRRVEEEQRRQMKERGSFSIQLPPSLRSEVLRLAAKRERELGEEFLARMEASKKEELANAATSAPDANVDKQGGGTQQRRPDPNEAPTAAAKRLRLAIQLLEDGDVERAIQFADPALSQVPHAGARIPRETATEDAKAADERYTALPAVPC